MISIFDNSRGIQPFRPENDKMGFCLPSLYLQAPHSVLKNVLMKAPLHACSSIYLGLALALTAPLSDELIREGPRCCFSS